MDLVDIDQLLGDLELQDDSIPSKSNANTNTDSRNGDSFHNHSNGFTNGNTGGANNEKSSLKSDLLDITLEPDFSLPPFQKSTTAPFYTPAPQAVTPQHKPTTSNYDDLLSLDFSLENLNLPPFRSPSPVTKVLQPEIPTQASLLNIQSPQTQLFPHSQAGMILQNPQWMQSNNAQGNTGTGTINWNVAPSAPTAPSSMASTVQNSSLNSFSEQQANLTDTQKTTETVQADIRDHGPRPLLIPANTPRRETVTATSWDGPLPLDENRDAIYANAQRPDIVRAAGPAVHYEHSMDSIRTPQSSLASLDQYPASPKQNITGQLPVQQTFTDPANNQQLLDILQPSSFHSGDSTRQQSGFIMPSAPTGSFSSRSQASTGDASITSNQSFAKTQQYLSDPGVQPNNQQSGLNTNSQSQIFSDLKPSNNQSAPVSLPPVTTPLSQVENIMNSNILAYPTSTQQPTTIPDGHPLISAVSSTDMPWSQPEPDNSTKSCLPDAPTPVGVSRRRTPYVVATPAVTSAQQQVSITSGADSVSSQNASSNIVRPAMSPAMPPLASNSNLMEQSSNPETVVSPRFHAASPDMGHMIPAQHQGFPETNSNSPESGTKPPQTFENSSMFDIEVPADFQNMQPTQIVNDRIKLQSPQSSLDAVSSLNTQRSDGSGRSGPLSPEQPNSMTSSHGSTDFTQRSSFMHPVDQPQVPHLMDSMHSQSSVGFQEEVDNIMDSPSIPPIQAFRSDSPVAPVDSTRQIQSPQDVSRGFTPLETEPEPSGFLPMSDKNFNNHPIEDMNPWETPHPPLQNDENPNSFSSFNPPGFQQLPTSGLPHNDDALVPQHMQVGRQLPDILPTEKPVSQSPGQGDDLSDLQSVNPQTPQTINLNRDAIHQLLSSPISPANSNADEFDRFLQMHSGEPSNNSLLDAANSNPLLNNVGAVAHNPFISGVEQPTENPLLREAVPVDGQDYGFANMRVEDTIGSLDSFTQLQHIGVADGQAMNNSLLQQNVTSDLGWDVGSAPRHITDADDILRELGLDEDIQPQVSGDLESTGVNNSQQSANGVSSAPAVPVSKRQIIQYEPDDGPMHDEPINQHLHGYNPNGQQYGHNEEMYQREQPEQQFTNRTNNQQPYTTNQQPQQYMRNDNQPPLPLPGYPPPDYPLTDEAYPPEPQNVTPVFEPIPTTADLQSMVVDTEEGGEEEDDSQFNQGQSAAAALPQGAEASAPVEDQGAVGPQSDDAFLSEVMDLGATEPKWVPDGEAHTCTGCNAAFKLLKRRHHCRACGQVFCSGCSNMKSRLQYKDFKEERVCRQCHELIAQAAQQQSRLMQTVNKRADQPTDSPPGVLRDPNIRGNTSRDPNRTVMFSDGIRPGDENSHLDGADVQPTSKVKRKNKGRARMSPRMRETLRSTFLIPDNSLPPLLSYEQNGTYTVEDAEPAEAALITQLTELGAECNYAFAIHKDLKIRCRILTLDCCMKDTKVWCFSSDGLSSVSQDEVLLLIKYEEGESTVPKDIFYFYKHLYQEASNGNQVCEMGYSDISNIQITNTEEGFLNSKNHAGFLFIRATFQCVKNLCLPEPPYLFAILLHRMEEGWARLFPVRLKLRIGAEYKYYPCPLFSVKNREPVYRNHTTTIINLLADFNTFKYSLPKIDGFYVHLMDKLTIISIPKQAFPQVSKIIESSQDAVLSCAASFGMTADSHLVCVQNEEGGYTAQAMSFRHQERTVTGASFVLFNGSLKESAGQTAKCSIVEDGIMVHVSKEYLNTFKEKLSRMEDFTIICGRAGDESDETPNEEVRIVWTDDFKQFNIGVISQIDGKVMDGITSSRVKTHIDWSHENHSIRWTEVFFIQMDQSRFYYDSLEITQFVEGLARSTSVALAPHLQQLHQQGMKKIGLRISLGPEQVEYVCGSRGQKLQSSIMNSLDGELIMLLHNAVNTMTGDSVLILELMFHILE